MKKAIVIICVAVAMMLSSCEFAPKKEHVKLQRVGDFIQYAELNDGSQIIGKSFDELTQKELVLFHETFD